MKLPHNFEALENKIFFLALMVLATYLYSLYTVFDWNYLIVISVKFFAICIYSVAIIYLAYKSKTEDIIKYFAIVAIAVGTIPIIINFYRLFMGGFDYRWFQVILTFFAPAVIIASTPYLKSLNIKKIIRLTLRVFIIVMLIGFIYKTTEGKGHAYWVKVKEQKRLEDIGFTEQYGEADSLYEAEFEMENPEPSHFSKWVDIKE